MIPFGMIPFGTILNARMLVIVSFWYKNHITIPAPTVLLVPSSMIITLPVILFLR